MALNIKNIVSTYGLSVNEVEGMYNDAYSGAINIGGSNPNENLISKFFIDLLEERGIPFNIACKISDYYIYTLAENIESKKEKANKKLIKLEDKDELEEEAQTSGQINSALGMNKNNPKYSYKEIYN